LVAMPEVESQEEELSQESEEEGGEVHSRSERERARRMRAMGIAARGAPMMPAKRMAKMRHEPKDSMRFTWHPHGIGGALLAPGAPWRAAQLYGLYVPWRAQVGFCSPHNAGGRTKGHRL